MPRRAGRQARLQAAFPEAERWYFLEEWYPKYGNLVPRDIATRAIHKCVYEHDLGIDGQPMVYLDLTHIDRETLNRKLEGILEIYEKFVGDDPREVPMKIFPGMHYTMGGLWVDINQIDQHSRHFCGGRMRIPDTTAPTGWARTRWCPASMADSSAGPHAREVREERGRGGSAMVTRQTKRPARKSMHGLMTTSGNENPFRLWRELGETMTEQRHRHPLQQGI